MAAGLPGVWVAALVRSTSLNAWVKAGQQRIPPSVCAPPSTRKATPASAPCLNVAGVVADRDCLVCRAAVALPVPAEAVGHVWAAQVAGLQIDR